MPSSSVPLNSNLNRMIGSKAREATSRLWAIVRVAGSQVLATPSSWRSKGVSCVLKGTGREALTGEDRRLLGALASRFPLFA